MKSVFTTLSCFMLFVSTSFAQWDSLAGGLNGYSPQVKSLCVYKGALYVGGRFATAGSVVTSDIASWNGTWSNVGAGISKYPVWVVNAMIADTLNNSLIVGGAFDTAGGVRNDDIAAWNGVTWQAMPGLDSYSTAGVNAIATYHDSVYAGGRFAASINIIGCWNNTNWNNLDSGLNGLVYAEFVYKGNLYVGGAFSAGIGNPASVIAIWNGANWAALGSGIGYDNGAVTALTIYNGNLIIGGSFDSAGGMPIVNLAQWNGVSWSAIGGLNPSNINGWIQCLTVYNGKLIVGGSFDTIGGMPANNIAVWDGVAWSALGKGTNGLVNAITGYNGALYAGGEFDSAGGQPANSIAVWSGPVGINELQSVSTSVTVYPNPSNGVFTIQSSVISQRSSVEVYNMIGQQIYTSKLNTGTTQINLSNNASGIYLYRITTEQGEAIASGKLIKE